MRMFPMRNFMLGKLVVAAAILTSVGRAPAQDAEKGKQVFVQCAVCHAPDQKNGTGPGLGGVMGRKAGTAPGFRYSRAMKTAGITWNETTLEAYVLEPQKIIPGNVMPFSGLPSAEARQDLIAYLKTLK